MSKNPLKYLEKLPPATRFAVVGGTATALGIVAYRRRQTAAATEVTSGETIMADTGDTGSPGPAAGGYSNGNIPIVISGGSTTTANNDGTLVSSYLDSIGKVNDQLSSLFGRTFDIYADQNNSRDGYASNMLDRAVDIIQTGGGAMAAPATVVVNPVAAPAPVYVAPAPAPAVNKAPAGFPHWNATRGLWYKNSGANSAGKDSNGRAYKRGDSLNVYQNGLVIKDN